jgi:CHAT domain-containing protein
MIKWKRLFWLGLALLTLLGTQLLAQPSSSSPSLLKTGIELYQAQRYQEAIVAWENSLTHYQKTDSLLYQALNLHYLSLAYQQQGNWENAQETISTSLHLLQQTSPSPLQTEILAKALNTQGRLQYQQGKPETAQQTWEQSAQLYAQIGNKKGQLIAQLNQTQALQAQGFPLKAKQHLQTLSETFPEDATTLFYLGVALQQVGDFSASLATLEKSLRYQERPKTWFALANTEVKLGEQAWQQKQWQSAQDYFASAERHYQKAESILKAQLNQLQLRIETGKWQEALTLLPKVEKTIAQLPVSGKKVSSYYALAESLICLRPDYQPQASTCSQFWQKKPAPVANPPLWKDIATIASTGLTQARALGDIKREAVGLGRLGNLYEHTQQWATAKELTHRAYTSLNPIKVPKWGYRWEWQLGRIETALGNVESAIAAYSSSLLNLSQVRRDLISVNADLHFSFREEVEPVYREYVELLLKGEPNQDHLNRAIAAMNNLQLAELENYLRCSLRSRLNLTQNLTEIDPNAVYIYPILLPNQLAVIAQFPQQPLKFYRHSLSEDTVTSALQKLQTGILRRRSELTLNQAKQFYQWLIAPLETDLANQPHLNTLVFTLDPKLRNLPLPVLYDEQQEEYLVDKSYAIALTPNSQLFSLQGTRTDFEVLGGGISRPLQVGKQRFSPLQAAEELSQLQTLTDSLVLLDQEFTPLQLETNFERQPFSIIHLATHAQFSSNPEQTYVLTYDETGEGKLLNGDQFSGLLQRLQQQSRVDSLKLLVLSACETATGDDRALLGLAGIAIQSGVESTLATEWQVSDQSTVTLMKHFYEQLTQSGVSKAQALHQAQQVLRNDPNTQNPFFWGGYVLVGNWL